MKRKLLSFALCLVMLLTLLPTAALAYIGPVRNITDTGSKGGGGSGSGTIAGVTFHYLYLQNPYITFAVPTDWDYQNPNAKPDDGYLHTFTTPSRGFDLKTQSFYIMLGGEDHNFYLGNTKSSSPAGATHIGVTSIKGSVKHGKTPDDTYTTAQDYDYVELNLAFTDTRFTATIDYRLVRLNKGADSGTLDALYVDEDKKDNTQNWGVCSTITFKMTNPEDMSDLTTGYRPFMQTDFSQFGRRGHVSLDNIFQGSTAAPDVYLGTAKPNYLQYGSFSKFELSGTRITDGLGLTKTSDWKTRTYQTEAYTDSYPCANAFVALSDEFYRYDDGTQPNAIKSGVQGFDMHYAFLPSYVSYADNTLTTYSSANENMGTDARISSTAQELWGFRTLYTSEETPSFSDPDKVTISATAAMVAVFKDGSGYKAYAADDDAALARLKRLYGTPVSVIRGTNTRQSDNSFKFTGAVALTSTVTAFGGTLTVSPDGSITVDGKERLNAPSFQFYCPVSSSGTLLQLKFTDDGIVATMDPGNNDAVTYMDIPYCKVTLKTAALKSSGDIVMGGDIGFDTVFSGAKFSLDQLGYGYKNGAFAVNGVHATGHFDTEEMFNLKLAQMDGEINTFDGQELYSFSASLNAFDMFSAAASLSLVRCKNTGVLMPDNLHFSFESDKITLPLVPPTPVAELTGIGGGFKDLAKTVNGDYFAIPPVKLEGEASGRILKVVKGKADVSLGAGSIAFQMKDIGLEGAPDGVANLIDSFGFKFGLTGRSVNYGGVPYKGIQFYGDINATAKLPGAKKEDSTTSSSSKDDSKDGDWTFFELSGDIGTNAFGGLNDAGDKLYLAVNANGKASAVVKVPSKIKIIGGWALAGVSADLILGGQTVVDVGENTSFSDSAKSAFKDIKVYLGAEATGTLLGSQARIWAILPDVIKDNTKGKYWGYDYAILSSLPDWNWNSTGITTLNSSSTQSAARTFYAATPAAKSADIKLAAVETDEQAYLALSFDPTVTQEQLQSELSVKDSSNNAVSLTWLAKDSSGATTNAATANATSDLVYDKNGVQHRVAIIHLGGSECSGKTYTVSTTNYAFTYEQTKTQPLDSLNATFNGSTVTGSVSYPVSGKTYLLRTYLASKKGGSDYLIDQRTVTDPANISVPVEASGTAAPTGEYYVTSFLMDQKTGDFDGDGTSETAWVGIDSNAFDTTVSYINTNQPAAPATVTLAASGNETMRGTWSKVDNVSGYQLTIYQKQSDGSYTDTGFGYQLDTSGTKLPAGLTYDSQTSTYSMDMAMTSSGSDPEGNNISLSADKTYKLGVKAFKTDSVGIGGETTTSRYFSTETQSGEKYLPAYTPLTMTLAMDGTALSQNSSGVYTATINGSGTHALTVSSANSGATFSVVRMDTNQAITASSGSYAIPDDVEGSLMLQITGSVTANGVTDITPCYLAIQIDNTAPVLSLSSATFYANPDTGAYTITGQTEPGLTVTETYNNEPTTTAAASDGTFTKTGTIDLENGDISKMVMLTASDAMGNTSNSVTALISMGTGQYTVTFDPVNGTVSPETAVTTDQKLSSLPTPTRSGYTFAGWYTASDGGTAVTTSTMFSSPTTVYAHWTTGGGSTDAVMTPTIITGNGGKATLSADGTKLTITPNRNYRVKDVTLNGVSKGAVTTLADLKTGDKVIVSFEWVNPFTDVKTKDYFFNAVKWALDSSVTTGTTATTFSPAKACTRAQVVTFLWRAMGSPEPAGTTNPFTDVDSGAYYYKAVLWAVEKGITEGTGATTFSPNKTVTRAEFVTFLWRAAGSPAATGASNFKDVTDTEAYYYQAVAWAAEKGITAGTTPATFSLGDVCSRGQVVTFLYRWLGK